MKSYLKIIVAVLVGFLFGGVFFSDSLGDWSVFFTHGVVAVITDVYQNHFNDILNFIQGISSSWPLALLCCMMIFRRPIESKINDFQFLRKDKDGYTFNWGKVYDKKQNDVVDSVIEILQDSFESKELLISDEQESEKESKSAESETRLASDTQRPPLDLTNAMDKPTIDLSCLLEVSQEQFRIASSYMDQPRVAGDIAFGAFRKTIEQVIENSLIPEKLAVKLRQVNRQMKGLYKTALSITDQVVASSKMYEFIELCESILRIVLGMENQNTDYNQIDEFMRKAKWSLKPFEPILIMRRRLECDDEVAALKHLNIKYNLDLSVGRTLRTSPETSFQFDGFCSKDGTTHIAEIMSTSSKGDIGTRLNVVLSSFANIVESEIFDTVQFHILILTKDKDFRLSDRSQAILNSFKYPITTDFLPWPTENGNRTA